MYKVFIYDKPVLIANKSQFEGSFEQFSKNSPIEEIIKTLKNNKNTGAEVIVDDIEAYFIKFKKFFKFIIAAGGTVFNEKNELLVIYRLKKWDLPKGKLEKGEDIPTCAVREVEEECNVNDLNIIKELESTYHCYYHKNKWSLKRTYWFEMKTNFKGKLIPQTEEDIEKVEWLPKSDWGIIKENTYNSIKEVLF
mgnify:FL=1|jgi:ADP-ribose pyrophosphatase YjhB (NUDIX family)|tara:strand:- start:327 stop:908 length:582 start_codon:yes stop_codon:yes gene_type:complete